MPLLHRSCEDPDQVSVKLKTIKMNSALWTVIDTNFICWVVMKETMSTSALLAKTKVV